MLTNNDAIDAHSNFAEMNHTFEFDPTAKVEAMEKRIARALRTEGIEGLKYLIEENYTSLARFIVLAQTRSTAVHLGLGLVADAVGYGAWWEPDEEFAIRCEVPNEFEERRLRAALGL